MGGPSGEQKGWEIPRPVFDTRSNRIQVRSGRRESLASRRKIPTAADAEDNLSQRRMEKSEAFGSLGKCWNSRKRKNVPAAREVPIQVLST